ncbi:MAG: transposase [Rickettsiales bacterium]|jgi:hypothetical protein|nr:transposase [Rickettsiales bacterium]
MFKTLRDYLNQDFESYIREWFPNAYRVNSITWKTGDFNDTKPINKNKDSLSFNMRDKYARDFNSGEKAGDRGEIMTFKISKGNMFDNVPILELIKKVKLSGKLFGDKGYLSKKEVLDKLEEEHNMVLITRSRKKK